MTLPVYDHGLTRAAEDRAHATLREQRAALEDLKRDLRQRVQSEWADLNASRAELIAAHERHRAADVALLGMQAELDAGLRTVIDLLNAQQESLDAKLAELDARYRETASAVRLLAATGVLQPDMLCAQGERCF